MLTGQTKIVLYIKSLNVYFGYNLKISMIKVHVYIAQTCFWFSCVVELVLFSFSLRLEKGSCVLKHNRSEDEDVLVFVAASRKDRAQLVHPATGRHFQNLSQKTQLLFCLMTHIC